jgi:hypothetical protein
MIWQQCNGSKHIKPFNDSAWRIVEAQHIISTRKLVDSLEEQEILEELIETSKPPVKEETSTLHYLLYTAFRYPPLKHGSRFGTKFEPSCWYGSLELDAALAETAFYRFHSLRASKADFGNVITNHTAFAALIKTTKGIDLTQSPFDNFVADISSPHSYEQSQLLGKAMREDGVEAFCYQSARDPSKRKNIALFTPTAFLNKKPVHSSFQSWQCIMNRDVADFIRVAVTANETKSFNIDMFTVNEKLPFPAM